MTDNGPTGRENFYKILMATLILGFSFYNYLIYQQEAPTEVQLSQLAINGQQLFQDNNCVSCHQFYGLGGYLGPDLTNVYSKRGDAYIHAMLNSGIKSMPKFEFNQDEKEAITQFLSEVDKSGIYPNYNTSFSKFGWVNIEYKDDEKLSDNFNDN